ncbi:ATP-binding cassette domain-containing protein [Candidatus Fermentibacteria bacterium]|nr:ATP-binding cassette domain-containing protein [Candidatus Fermentibacteria bacterium]
MREPARAVNLDDVVVDYGNARALDGLDLTIPSRGVFGLLGRNGAGKTTTIRAILGLVSLTGGSVEVLGLGRDRIVDVRGRVAAVFSESGLLPTLTTGENLRIWGMMDGLGSSEACSAARSVLERMDVADLYNTKVTDLSTGNARIAALARAFMLDREMVILDEPTASLDPVRADRVRKGISRMSDQAQIMLSTHDLHEAEELCDLVAIIDRGRLVASGSPDDLRGEGNAFLVRTESGKVTYEGVNYAMDGSGYVRLSSDDAPHEVLGKLLAEGNKVLEFRPEKRSLAEIFLELAGGGE